MLRRRAVAAAGAGAGWRWVWRQLSAGNVKPLEGIKVLDLTRVLAGPFATMILGDLGAEIIKVERPGAGDETRAWGPPFVGTESIYFLSVNRNKKSIAVNLKNPDGIRIIKDLASVCDVLIENYVSGKLAEMGLGYKDIEAIAPHIVYCSITGYGQTGPMSQRAGYDSVACAVSGLMHITGPEAFKTKDGYLVVGAGNDQHFAIVCKILSLPALSEEPRYKTNKLRVQNRGELIDVLSARFSEKTTQEWLQLLEGSGIPYGPINSIQQAFSEPQVKHNDLILEMYHPTAGNIAVPGPAVRFSDFKISNPKPPPLTGQHTVEVLKTLLGYSDNFIKELLAAETVAQHELN
ncbi:succinate--hydroxymethylglutarate CoA-transferase isoform X6 [Hypanus sabinus]|uniref:succinate--hydroxymethylglutarate CoA-transferase isoform X6 n=1 Tax=Hypanus sabinus TaxID=79690 RepID=UPI0028C47A2E|nr:succinate--hydroxymethylglutarate CoA-transferase isoform X6 [Hypanus sabinus]